MYLQHSRRSRSAEITKLSYIARARSISLKFIKQASYRLFGLKSILRISRKPKERKKKKKKRSSLVPFLQIPRAFRANTRTPKRCRVYTYMYTYAYIHVYTAIQRERARFGRKMFYRRNEIITMIGRGPAIGPLSSSLSPLARSFEHACLARARACNNASCIYNYYHIRRFPEYSLSPPRIYSRFFSLSLSLSTLHIDAGARAVYT